MKDVFRCFCESLQLIEDVMKKEGKEFMWNEYFGFIFICLLNFGMGLCVGVYVKFFCLFKDLCFVEILKVLCF